MRDIDSVWPTSDQSPCFKNVRPGVSKNLILCGPQAFRGLLSLWAKAPSLLPSPLSAGGLLWRPAPAHPTPVGSGAHTVLCPTEQHPRAVHLEEKMLFPNWFTQNLSICPLQEDFLQPHSLKGMAFSSSREGGHPSSRCCPGHLQEEEEKEPRRKAWGAPRRPHAVPCQPPPGSRLAGGNTRRALL